MTERYKKEKKSVILSYLKMTLWAMFRQNIDILYLSLVLMRKIVNE